MDRESLAQLLDKGLSLAEIGRRFGKDESTVGYWVKKHGLQAANREKHAARGGIGRDDLAALAAAGLTIRQIAAQTGLSATTVRHWLRQYGLATKRSGRRAQGRAAHAEGLAEIEMECLNHGLTLFRLEGRGAYRCLACRQERVTARRRENKEVLVAEAGGACVACGYQNCIAALQFHHLDPSTKQFGISAEGSTRSLAASREEAKKCALVCANCHAEIEAGLLTILRVGDKVIIGAAPRARAA